MALRNGILAWWIWMMQAFQSAMCSDGRVWRMIHWFSPLISLLGLLTKENGREGEQRAGTLLSRRARECVCAAVHTSLCILCLYIALQLRVRKGPWGCSQSLTVSHLLGRGHTAQFRRKNKLKQRTKQQHKVLLRVSKVPATSYS